MFRMNALIQKNIIISFFIKNRQFLSQIAIAVLFRGLSAAATFILTIVVARYLSPDQSGLFFLGFSVATLLGTFCLMGMDNIILRFIGYAKKNNDTTLINQIFCNAYLSVLPFSTIIAISLYFLSPYLAIHFFAKPNATEILQVFAIIFPFISLSFLHGYAQQAIGRIIQSVFSMQLGATSLFLLIAGAIFFTQPTATAIDVSVYYLIAIITTVLAGIFMWFSNTEYRLDFTHINMPNLWHSLPNFWLTSIMTQAMPWTSVIIVGFFLSSQDVAFFSTAQRTSLLISFILIVINFVAAPRFSALFHAGENKKLKHLAQLSTRLMCLLSLPMFVLMLLLPEKIMAIFGEEFVAASQLLFILSCGQIFNVMTGSVGFLLLMCGFEKEMRNIVLFSSFVTLTCTIFFTYLWGTLGAATAVSAGVILQNILATYKVKHCLGFWPI